MTEPELLREVDGPVLNLVLNRPHRRNAMSFTLMGDLLDALLQARHDDSVRVVVLSGSGTAAFCAGADLGGIADNSSFVELHESRGRLADVFRALWDLGKPTVAKVRGYALAGGFGLACACDIVIASDDATFGTPEIDVGLWPYMITVPLLRSMPSKAVLELMMSGRRIDAREAQRLGAVSRVVAADELDGCVAELVQGLATKPPVTMRWGRDAFYNVLQTPDASQALEYLQTMLTLTTNTADAAEGVAAFAEKRAPRWTGQ